MIPLSAIIGKNRPIVDIKIPGINKIFKFLL
jgi:hypothetical protein